MSAVRALAFGMDMTLLRRHFAVVTEAVGVLRFPVQSNKFPPTVRRVWQCSSLSGLMLQTIFPSVTVFSPKGTFYFGMKLILSVPLMFLIP